MATIIDFQGTIQFRRALSDEWVTQNPILATGEMGIELDTKLFKIGDGILRWADLPYGGLRGEKGEGGEKGEQGPIGDVTPAALQALSDAKAAQFAAESARDSANASKVSAGASETAAQTAREGAELARDQTQVYSEAANTDAASAKKSAEEVSVVAADVLAIQQNAANALATANEVKTYALDKKNNLSDVNDVSSARSNLDIYSKQEIKDLLPETWHKGLRSRVIYSEVSFSAKKICLIDASGNRLILPWTTDTKAEIAKTGPIVGGIDKGTPFTTSQWLYVYAIYNPTTQTKGAIISADPNKPNLPVGFTYWAFAHPVRCDAPAGTAGMYRSWVQGNVVKYPGRSLPLYSENIWTATFDRTTAYMSYVPPLADVAIINGSLDVQQDGQGNCVNNFYVGDAAGSFFNHIHMLYSPGQSSTNVYGNVPNMQAQQMFRIVNDRLNANNAQLYLFVDSYTYPNGAI